MYREKRNDEELNINDLAMINGGVAPVVIAVGVVATPFVLGAIAGGADEYAKKERASLNMIDHILSFFVSNKKALAILFMIICLAIIYPGMFTFCMVKAEILGVASSTQSYLSKV